MNLEARGITVDIAGCKIVASASFKVAAGEFVGLIGPNGAGKSTLLKAVLGLRERSAGEVFLNGSPFADFPKRERAKHIAFLPQDRSVEWRLRVRDVVMLGRYPHQSGFGGPSAACNAAVDRALNLVDAEGLADRPISVLSGGERTRALLARALAVEAPLLLVDEPITALDPYHQLHVMEILLDLSRRGVGVLAVIHDLSLAMRFMDRIVLMHRGAIVNDGPPAAVLTNDTLEAVYQIDAVRGERDQRQWILPWGRTSSRPPEAL